jgi:Rrf2 family protein
MVVAVALSVGVVGNREYNPGWHTALDLHNMLVCSEAIAMCALERKESRGGHFRDDFPEKNPAYGKFNIVVKRGANGEMQVVREPIPCSQLAAEGHMPERFLLQILRHLVIHGILHSTRGVDGGYTLERKPEEISLLEIIEAIDGPLDSGPSDDGAVAAQSESLLRDALEQITATARQQLQAIKVSDLMRSPPKQAVE